jgi:mannan endo-1,4-beta-mannosidase
MTGFIKSIDDKHLLTVGLEGFYGPNSPKGLTVNPEQWASQLGTDFVQNSNSSNIDFASVHIYPDHWFHNQTFEEKLKFVVKWMQSHIEDGLKELKKPVLFTELAYQTRTRTTNHRSEISSTESSSTWFTNQPKERSQVQAH